jgi:hypothetical protein
VLPNNSYTNRRTLLDGKLTEFASNTDEPVDHSSVDASGVSPEMRSLSKVMSTVRVPALTDTDVGTGAGSLGNKKSLDGRHPNATVRRDTRGTHEHCLTRCDWERQSVVRVRRLVGGLDREDSNRLPER